MDFFSVDFFPSDDVSEAAGRFDFRPSLRRIVFYPTQIGTNLSQDLFKKIGR